MHTNPASRTAGRAQSLAFARARGFGILMLNGADGPLASHVPFVLSGDGTSAEVHLTRSNPITRAAPGPALLAISGPDAYVSPDWYGLEDQVPTWNYIAVHLRGSLAPMDPDLLHGHVDSLSAIHESRLLPKRPWTSAKMSKGTMPRMLRMILPFRLTIASVEGTWKLGQNKPFKARAGVADALSQGDASAQAIAGLIRDLP